MQTCLTAVHRALEWLLVLFVAVLIVPVSLQVFSRQTDLIPTYLWTEELARFCFVWMIMIGAMLAVRESAHFDVDLLPELSPRGQAALSILTHLLMLVFAVVFIHYGLRFALFGKDQLSEIAELPMWMIFAAWPLAGLIWAVFLGEKLVQSVRVLRQRVPA
jgi:TRAP-type C4-dicarboxylate transport system permease small subunit